MSLVDFHNHLMPGVDDGARTEEEAETALRRFKEQGVTTVIASPHLEASLIPRREQFEQRLAELDRAFETLQRVADRVGGVTVGRAVELLLDLPDPDLSDARLRINGGRHFLMEFPFMAVPPHSERAVSQLSRSGYIPIIAHPERYRGIRSQLGVAERWKDYGALLQINAGSLLGKYGTEARAMAIELMARGWVDYIGSDYHARGTPALAPCRQMLEAAGAIEQVVMLMQTNPARMLQGEAPIPVAPFRFKTNMWERLVSLFKS